MGFGKFDGEFEIGQPKNGETHTKPNRFKFTTPIRLLTYLLCVYVIFFKYFVILIYFLKGILFLSLFYELSSMWLLFSPSLIFKYYIEEKGYLCLLFNLLEILCDIFIDKKFI